MFQKAKNLDTAFRQLRFNMLCVVVISFSLCGFTIYKSFDMAKTVQGKIYVLANGQAIKALATDRKENLLVQAKSHIKNFHKAFFTLAPDEQQIQNTINEALYLADNSAKKQYDNLRESNYYVGLVSGNVNTKVFIDSVSIDNTADPISFIFYGKQEITRPTSLVLRSLITSGTLREVEQSDNNPHGFLIEKWKILDNKDLEIKNR